MKTLKLIIPILISILITGCAHKIAIGPDISMISRGGSAELIPAKVGYYFPQGAREKEVITPGGGGDRVRYKPYADIETAFSKMLGNIFKDVTALESGNESEIAKNSIDYVVSLEILTNSSSASAFTWPPTWFSVNLASRINDSAGKNITNVSVTGEGKAEFGEFIADKGLSGKRAAFDALAKMQNALIDTEKFKTATMHASQPIKTAIKTKENSAPEKSLLKAPEKNDVAPQSDTASKLKKLNDLYSQGLITKDELAERRSKILDSL